MRTIELNITLEDIQQGTPSECSKCPIALALKRAVPGITALAVDTSFIYFQEDRKFFVWTPLEAGDFINNFDRGNFVEPFHLTLEFSERSMFDIPIPPENIP